MQPWRVLLSPGRGFAAAPSRFYSAGAGRTAGGRPRGQKFAIGAATVVVGAFAANKALVYTREERKKRILATAVEDDWPTREKSVAALQTDREFDVLIVGGGATGCGAALDAALRGLSVALVEKEDFGSGTSSRSTKLLWAGSRYLVQGLVNFFGMRLFQDPVASWNDLCATFKMVLGCHRERHFLLEVNPHLTHWLPIAVPLDSWILWPPPFDYPLAALGPLTYMFPLFFKFYDFLGGFISPSAHVISASQAAYEFPQLSAREGNTMKYVSIFYEGQHNDSRTNLALAMTASMKGATVANHTEVVEILYGADGKANGARVKDAASQECYDIRAKSILFCGGPFTDGLRKLSEGQTVDPCVRGASGTHIVLPGYFTPDAGFVDMQTSDGRFLFFLPWLNHTLVGTTDKAVDDITLHSLPPEEEVQWLIQECNKYLHPSIKVDRENVLSAWQGVRPLARDPNDTGDTKSASRDHIISRSEKTGVTFIAGGKWTTYREMAEDVIDDVLKHAPAEMRARAGPCTTTSVPLIGAGPTANEPSGFDSTLKYKLAKQYHFKIDVAEHMAATYGTRAHDVMAAAKDVEPSKTGLAIHYGRLYPAYPYIEAEVRYAVQREYAVTAEDILSRRTRLAYLNIKAAKIVLPRVCEIMQEELGWSDSRRKQEEASTMRVLNLDFVDRPKPSELGAAS